MPKALCVGVYNPKNICQASPMCGDQVFAKGLEKNGYEVTRFDYRATQKPNEDLITITKNIKYDLFWFGKAERITFETLVQLRKEFPNAIFCKWGADVRDEPPKFDIEQAKLMDFFFGTYGGEYLKKYKSDTNTVASIVTFTDSDFYKKSRYKKEWSSNVLWTGRRGFGDNNIRNKVIDYLLQRKDTKVYGLNEWLYYPEYLYAIENTKIGIGVNSFNRPKYSSDRLGSFITLGTFYLCHYFEGIEEIFERGTTLDWFMSVDELNEKIKFYLSHDSLRQEIAKNSQNFILKYFDYKPLVQNLLEIINTGKSNFSWTEIY